MKKIIFIKVMIISIFVFSSCTFKSSNFESFRLEIVNLLKDNKKIIIMNNLHTVEEFNLIDKEEEYYGKRLDHIIAFLNREESDTKDLFIKFNDFYKSLPIKNKEIFDWSNRNFTSQILCQIEDKYGNIEIPIDLIKEIYYGPVRK